MGRSPCCDKNIIKKGPWTVEEDDKLLHYIRSNGYGNWRTLPINAGLQRCGKSCRLRWINYLRPDIKRGKFTSQEEESIIHLHSFMGNKWSAIAARLPGRTDNEIKNYWNTHIKKRLLRMGIDPVTHNPRLDLLGPSWIDLYYPSQQMYLKPSLHEILRLATSIFPTKHEIPHQNNLPAQNHCQPSDYGDYPYLQQLNGGDMSCFINISDNPLFESNKTSEFQMNLTQLSRKEMSSSSTYVNGGRSGKDDDRGSYFSNDYDMLKFEIPDIYDINDFL